MTSHELARKLLEGPDLPVSTEVRGPIGPIDSDTTNDFTILTADGRVLLSDKTTCYFKVLDSDEVEDLGFGEDDDNEDNFDKHDLTPKGWTRIGMYNFRPDDGCLVWVGRVTDYTEACRNRDVVRAAAKAAGYEVLDTDVEQQGREDDYYGVVKARPKKEEAK